ncbi:MAG: Tfp pilus assembly protein PilF [Maribacter sp.]|jgi:Tfp pilus assembly protein PilF
MLLFGFLNLPSTHKPKSENLYVSLAETYVLKGDIQNAISNFKKLLQIDPKNKNAKTKLKQLK